MSRDILIETSFVHLYDAQVVSFMYILKYECYSFQCLGSRHVWLRVYSWTALSMRYNTPFSV